LASYIGLPKEIIPAMLPLFQTVTDVYGQAAILKERAYGVIEIVDGRLEAIQLRPLPTWIILSGAGFSLAGKGKRCGDNRCWLYYNQPRNHRRFLALKYIVSSRRATLKTVRGALVVLDEIARIKQSDALLCEVRNLRISDRVLARDGWVSHFPQSRRRHFIKRFYGNYPDPKEARALCRTSLMALPCRPDASAACRLEA
jgi:hypothetical protein